MWWRVDRPKPVEYYTGTYTDRHFNFPGNDLNKRSEQTSLEGLLTSPVSSWTSDSSRVMTNA